MRREAQRANVQRREAGARRRLEAFASRREVARREQLGAAAAVASPTAASVAAVVAAASLAVSASTGVARVRERARRPGGVEALAPRPEAARDAACQE